VVGNDPRPARGQGKAEGYGCARKGQDLHPEEDRAVGSGGSLDNDEVVGLSST
jgi:hypothetical protein